MSTAVIEYEHKGFTPAPDLLGWDIQGQIVHAVGVIASTGKKYLAELRTELEEAGLTRTGTAKPRESLEVYGSKWREVWRGKGEIVIDHFEPSPRAQKARQQSASRTRLYQSRQKERQMKDDVRLMELASKAKARWPELTTRAMNAAELVRAGKVKRISTTTFRVESQTGEGKYTVDIHKRTCTCPDHLGTFRHSAPEINGAPMCKHRLAALMKVKVEQRETDTGEIHRQEKQFRSALGARMIT